MKKTLIIIGLTALSLVVGCKKQEEVKTTGMITGMVSDSTGSPIDQAQVSTTPATIEVMTNDSGVYEIPDVEPGDYTVGAQKRTYIPKSVNTSVTASNITTANISLNQSLRNVLGEMLTTACHCGDDARAEGYAVKSGCGTRFVYLEYHASCDPYFETWDPFATLGSESRRLYYGADTFLLGNWIYFEGTNLQTSAGNYQYTVDSLLGKYSPLTMTITGSYSNSTGDGNLDVAITAVDTILPNDLVVEFAVYEKGPIDYSPTPPCVVPFEYVVVNIPDHEPLTISYGQMVNITKNFTVPDSIGGDKPPFHVVDKNNIGVALFVQSTGSKEILQAACHDF